MKRRYVTRVPDDVRGGLLRLLAVKDADVRLSILEQSRDAVDKGVHAGGAFSATVPLVALFYGGFLDLDIVDPTRRGQDMFVLSKGHAVAAMAAVYADLGYIDRDWLRNTRADASILNGHPGPLIPGVPIATGPMGQGLGVAQGFAIAGRMTPRFDAYALVGDGEVQEGTIWESVMYAGQNHLDNLCVLVDRNYGQLDVHNRMAFPMPDLAAVFGAFNWNVHAVDATGYDGLFSALEAFRHGVRNGRPTAIICHSTKGFGSFADVLNRHKVTVTDDLVEQEITLQSGRRQARVDEVGDYLDALGARPGGVEAQAALVEAARAMHLDLFRTPKGWTAPNEPGPVRTGRVPPRRKRIHYEAHRLPVLDPKKSYSAAEVITAAMKVFARDPLVVSIDADLASTSGLEAGIAAVDQARALNVGVAEANMMLIGEAFAALGHQTWVSTFCPFFNWQVLRRIAVGHQERLEAIASADGWLSEGHGIDLTLLATAANFETRTNGATHMGNDDSTTFDAVAHLKIIDVSCPQQMLAIMKWAMDGNRGLLYVRVMRTGSAVLYGADYHFEFGRGIALREHADDVAVIISSGRQVHESLGAARQCAERGVQVGVIDMPSVDEALLLKTVASGKLIVFAEQNDGYLWQNFLKVLYRHRDRLGPVSFDRVMAVNTLKDGHSWFIHSATYEELVGKYGLTPAALADAVVGRLQQGHDR